MSAYYHMVAVAWLIQSAAAYGANRMKGMQGWGWKIPTFIFFFWGITTLVADSGILSIIPHDLTRLHLIHRS